MINADMALYTGKGRIDDSVSAVARPLTGRLIL